jgi:sterol carrier protein 2
MPTAREIIEGGRERLRDKADAARQIGATYKFVLAGEGGGTWVVNLKDQVGIEECDDPADCTLRMAASDYVALIEGGASPQKLFFTGKLKVEGDMAVAMKLKQFKEIMQS